MNDIATSRLTLVLDSLEAARRGVDEMPPEHKAQLSAHWLKLLAGATEADPWILGFSMIRRDDGKPIGQCGFKGPPADGMVEIAYAVEPAIQSNGYATEAAEALTQFAFQDERVTLVRAHTLPEKNASTSVLTKCGFAFVGEVIDPEDGPVWRWERR